MQERDPHGLPTLLPLGIRAAGAQQGGAESEAALGGVAGCCSSKKVICDTVNNSASVKHLDLTWLDDIRSSSMSLRELYGEERLLYDCVAEKAPQSGCLAATSRTRP